MLAANVLAAARDGSPEAQGQVLEACREYLLAIANRRLGPDLQGQVRPSSLVQETFLRAAQHFDRFHGSTERDLLNWLRRILLHVLANEQRRLGAAKAAGGRTRHSLNEAAELAAPTDTPAQQAADRERDQELDQALARLPEHYRRVIELHHQEGRSFAEAGQTLGCSAEAARKLWARAVLKLRHELRAFHEPE
jgi:RNA polymerase sigma-70 factor (ECF subfamily)